KGIGPIGRGRPAHTISFWIRYNRRRDRPIAHSPKRKAPPVTAIGGPVSRGTIVGPPPKNRCTVLDWPPGPWWVQKAPWETPGRPFWPCWSRRTFPATKNKDGAGRPRRWPPLPLPRSFLFGDKTFIHRHHRAAVVTGPELLGSVKMIEMGQKVLFDIVQGEIGLIEFVVAVVAKP